MTGTPSPGPTRRAWIVAGLYFALALAGLVGTWFFNLTYAGGSYLADWFANRASSSLAVDLIVIGVVISVFYVRERDSLPGHRPRVALVFIPLTFLVAASFALPLFLGLRELGLTRSRPDPDHGRAPDADGPGRQHSARLSKSVADDFPAKHRPGAPTVLPPPTT
jgi:hypothetical protein